MIPTSFNHIATNLEIDPSGLNTSITNLEIIHTMYRFISKLS